MKGLLIVQKSDEHPWEELEGPLRELLADHGWKIAAYTTSQKGFETMGRSFIHLSTCSEDPEREKP